jgi:hypothetical protein
MEILQNEITRNQTRTAGFGIIGHQMCKLGMKILQNEITGNQTRTASFGIIGHQMCNWE